MPYVIEQHVPKSGVPLVVSEYPLQILVVSPALQPSWRRECKCSLNSGLGRLGLVSRSGLNR
jgi:hypothetical protein